MCYSNEHDRCHEWVPCLCFLTFQLLTAMSSTTQPSELESDQMLLADDFDSDSEPVIVASGYTTPPAKMAPSQATMQSTPLSARSTANQSYTSTVSPRSVLYL